MSRGFLSAGQQSNRPCKILRRNRICLSPHIFSSVSAFSINFASNNISASQTQTVSLQQVERKRAHASGENIIGHHALCAFEFCVRPADRPRFHNVEKPEQQKCRRPSSQRRRGKSQRKPSPATSSMTMAEGSDCHHAATKYHWPTCPAHRRCQRRQPARQNRPLHKAHNRPARQPATPSAGGRAQQAAAEKCGNPNRGRFAGQTGGDFVKPHHWLMPPPALAVWRPPALPNLRRDR